ncbi:ABC transporter permease/substrate-binding protein [Clostridium gasigenes]|uniref:ABC transporter permease/substrate-binding protein n=1 Tax=Clostridium gasigenes TaxID=94869 RepID=UPI001C0E26B8|nr:glycine betaine ABC transporter substrate-binding protein [Clostridium gasigenes]MBU3106860.1 ABC transporter permease subunit [Clostridium gasigenes]
MSNFFEFVINRKEEILSLFIQHIYLTFSAILIAILIGIPLGILMTKVKTLQKPIASLINVIQSIPSMALLGLLIPILGIGSVPAITMVVLYSLLPIVKNTYTGLTNINPDVLESARGMGLTSRQTLRLVQIPLALPLVMSGIRISAVMAVGLMTLAAFIGAGGLGYLVYSGIQTVNNNMILAGAIPSCILALVIDFLFGKIEVLIMPKGLNPNKHKSKSTGLKVTLAIILVALIGSSLFSVLKPKGETIVIGSKSFSEQLILGNMYAELIEEHTDLNVEKKLGLAGSSVTMEGLYAGEIDLMVEYTATLYINVLNQEPSVDRDFIYSKSKEIMEKEHNLTLLEPLGFNNGFTMAMKPEVADKYGITSISDLAKVSSELVFGPTLEFLNRVDGFPNLASVYNLNFKNVVGIDGALRYKALDNGESDVIDAFTTDGLLKSFNLKVLEDDLNFFAPYDAIPLVRMETLEKYPELKTVLNMLSGKLSQETMIDLNYKVDDLGEDPVQVAKEYLRSEGLIK